MGKTLLKRCNLKTLWSKISFFYITCIFLWKNLELVENAFFMSVEKKIKTILLKKVLVCSKDLKGAPSNALKLFSAKCFKFFFSTFIKNAFSTISIFFPRKYARYKNKNKIWLQGLQIAAFQQSFSQCWWKCPIFEGSLIQKPYLNPYLGSKFFSWVVWHIN